MSARELLADLRDLGVAVEVNNGFLNLDAPSGVVTDDLLESVTEHKPKLLKLIEWERHRREEADRRGLVIKWSREPGYVSIHDPTTGEWHEVKAEGCLPGVVATANKYRKKGGAS